MNIVISNDVKRRILYSIAGGFKKPEFVDEALIAAFMEIPKVHRIPIGFMISYFSRFEKLN